MDFLVSKGKAKVISNSSLTVKNGNTGSLNRSSGILYAALTPIDDKPINGTGKHGNAVNINSANEKFKFSLEVTPAITAKATTLNVKVATRSLLGYNSDGSIRSSDYNSSQNIMLGNGSNRFYLGGIEKTQTVSDAGGIPLLKDIPLLGWLFSTERESTKKTQLVVVAECEIIQPATTITPEAASQIEQIKRSNANAGSRNTYAYGQYGLDKEKSILTKN